MTDNANTPAVVYPSALSGQNFRVPPIAKPSAGLIAEGLWSKIEGADHKAKSDNLLLLIDSLRKARDDAKPAPSRKLRTPDEALEQSIGKSLSDLGAINVSLFNGTLSVNISQLFRMANDLKHPLHFESLGVVLDKGVHLSEKKATRGKAKLILAKGKYEAPTLDDYKAAGGGELVEKAKEFFATRPVVEAEPEAEEIAA